MKNNIYVIARRVLALRDEAIPLRQEIALDFRPRNDIFRSLFLIVFILSACAPSGGLWGYAPDAPRPTSTVMQWPTPAPTSLPVTPTITFTPAPRVQRVLIVTFDGLRPEAIKSAPMDNLIYLMKGAAYTLSAQTIVPPWTLPALSSMLDGMCQSKHGVTWDEYVPENGYAVGTDLFDLAHAAGLRTVMVVGKEKLRQITEPTSTDAFIFEDHEVGEDATVAQSAVAQINIGFGLMFVHFPNGDLVGHDKGWLSKEQLQAYHDADGSFKLLLDALVKNKMESSTWVIVTADHGGHDKNHLTTQPEDMTIPWIMAGPRISARQLTTPVNIMDTAATAAYALNLSIPAEWDGHVVKEAFGFPAETPTGPACP